MHRKLRPLLLCVLTAVGQALPLACSGATFITNPTSDAFVATGPTGNLSDNNYGGGGALAVAASGLPNGEFQSVIKFDLSGARSSFDTQFGAGQWEIQSISLQLSASPHNNAIYNNVASGLFGVSLMQNSTWVEGTGNASNPAANGITYNTLLGTFINNANDQALGTFSFDGSTSGATSYPLGLSSGLTADILAGDNLSLRLFGADTQVSYLFSSRSTSPSANEPTLIITAVPEPQYLGCLGLVSACCWLMMRARAASAPMSPTQIRVSRRRARRGGD